MKSLSNENQADIIEIVALPGLYSPFFFTTPISNLTQ